MSNIDTLIAKFKEVKEALSKEGGAPNTAGGAVGPTLGSMIGYPGAPATAPIKKAGDPAIESEVIKFDKSGQWRIEKGCGKK